MENTNECCTSILLKRNRKDRGFMGTTHALSGFALVLALVAFTPWFTQWAGLSSIPLIILAAVVVAGSALIPDLDNSVSTAKNSLGILGEGLSIFFRGSATAIQTVLRTSKDDPKIDPHRGFWHTIPAALLLGFLTWLATSIEFKVSVPLAGEVTVGWIAALLIVFVNVHMAFTGLFGKIMRKVLKGSASFETVAILAATIGTVALFWFIPGTQDFWWLSVSVALGAIAHIVGDTFTTAGTPILFPFSVFIKGRFWWKTRFLPIKAGGTIENYVFLPVFGLISVVSIVWMLIQ